MLSIADIIPPDQNYVGMFDVRIHKPSKQESRKSFPLTKYTITSPTTNASYNLQDYMLLRNFPNTIEVIIVTTNNDSYIYTFTDLQYIHRANRENIIPNRYILTITPYASKTTTYVAGANSIKLIPSINNEALPSMVMDLFDTRSLSHPKRRVRKNKKK
jgi:hypothetical protein